MNNGFPLLVSIYPHIHEYINHNIQKNMTVYPWIIWVSKKNPNEMIYDIHYV